MAKINLGCGEDYKEGWINIDKDPKHRAEMTCDIETFSTLDYSADEILLSHVLMYLRPEQLKPLLIRWYGWLKEGGKLTMETADFRKLCNIVSTEPVEDIVMSDGMINIFGKENEPPHTWGWTSRSLITLLEEIGFKNIVRTDGDKKPLRDFKLICEK